MGSDSQRFRATVAFCSDGGHVIGTVGFQCVAWASSVGACLLHIRICVFLRLH